MLAAPLKSLLSVPARWTQQKSDESDPSANRCIYAKSNFFIIMCKNPDGAMNRVYSEYFTNACPARAAFAVKDLPKGAMIEIEAIAVCG